LLEFRAELRPCSVYGSDLVASFSSPLLSSPLLSLLFIRLFWAPITLEFEQCTVMACGGWHLTVNRCRCAGLQLLGRQSAVMRKSIRVDGRRCHLNQYGYVILSDAAAKLTLAITAPTQL
jgi:hypothetical protein